MELKQRFGAKWHSVLQHLADDADKRDEDRRKFVPSVAEIWRLLCSLDTKIRDDTPPYSLVDYMNCYHYPEMYLGGINGVFYRLWPSMRGLKEHDTIETIVDDKRPFIPGNIFGLYPSLESRLHGGLRAIGIPHDEATVQPKLSQFSDCSRSRPARSDAAVTTTPIHSHSSTASNGLVDVEKSAPLHSSEVDAKLPHLFVNLGPIECFNEKTQKWQDTHYALVMDLENRTPWFILRRSLFEDLNSSDEEVDPRHQDRATGTLPLLTQPFSFALLEQEKMNDEGYCGSFDSTESPDSLKYASLTQTIPIGPTQARFRSNKKGKARRHEKEKFKKRVETEEKQEMMKAVSEAQLEDSSKVMENLILRSNKYRRLKLTLFNAPHDWMIVSAREDSDGTIYREGEFKQRLSNADVAGCQSDSAAGKRSTCHRVPIMALS